MKKRHQTKLMKFFKWIFGLVLIGLLYWGIRWTTFARPPLPEAFEALESDEMLP